MIIRQQSGDRVPGTRYVYYVEYKALLVCQLTVACPEVLFQLDIRPVDLSGILVACTCPAKFLMSQHILSMARRWLEQ